MLESDDSGTLPKEPVVRRISAIFALLSMLVLSQPASASPSGQSAPRVQLDVQSETYCADTEEFELLSEINDYRAANGLPSLTLSATLGAAADHHSESMASFNYFDASHDLHFEGANQDQTVTWQQNIANFGYPDNTHTSRAENLAAGYERAA